MRHPYFSWIVWILVSCSGGDGDPGDVGAVDTGTADTAWSDTGVSTPEPVAPHPWAQHCAAASAVRDVTSSGKGVSVTTEHFALYLEGEPAERAEAYGQLAEAAWLALAEIHDGAEPPQRPLDVRVYASQTAWQEGMQAEGVTVPASAGGYYDPGTQIASLFQQPTVYYSQTLFLHEVFHQFHALARREGRPHATWYLEGLAEHYSRHAWDGACVRLGVNALLSLEDYPAQATDELRGLDVPSAISGDTFPGRPSMFGLVRALDLDPGRHDAFSAFREAYDAEGGDALELLEAQGLLDGLEGTTLSEQLAPEPMTPVYLEWVPETADSLYGFADVLSFARLKEPPSSFTVSLEPGDGEGGVVLGYAGVDDWEVLLIDSAGTLSVFGVDGGASRWDIVASVDAPTGVVAFTVTPDEVLIDDAPVEIPRVHPAAAGVALYDAQRRFTGLRWTE